MSTDLLTIGTRYRFNCTNRDHDYHCVGIFRGVCVGEVSDNTRFFYEIEDDSERPLSRVYLSPELVTSIEEA